MIIAGMASAPGRGHILKASVDSIIDQVDALHIAFDYGHPVPEWMTGPPWYRNKLVIHHYAEGEAHGDNGKMFGLREDCDYYATIDDDLIYPPGYIDTCRRWMACFGDQAVVCSGGVRFRSWPIASYYREPGRHGVSAYGLNIKAAKVEFPYTAASFWSPRTLRFTVEDCPVPNMTDIWLAKAAAAQGLPCIAIPHPNLWLEYQHGFDQETTIWFKHRHKDRLMTEVANSIYAPVPDIEVVS